MKNLVKALVFCIFLIVFSATKGIAQFKDTKFEYLNADNGLSNNFIYSIHRDRKNYLWIGTEYGLNRFDGQKVTVYTASDSPNSLTSNGILHILEDTSGDLWISTWHGFNYFNRKTESFTRFITVNNNGMTSNGVTCSAQDKNGDIWLATLTGICRKEKGKDKFTAYPIPDKTDPKQSNTVNYILADGEFLWLATQGNKLWRMNVNTFQFESFTSEEYSATLGLEKLICLDKKNGIIWIGVAGSGLFAFNMKTKAIKKYPVKTDGSGTNETAIRGLCLDNESKYLYIAIDLGGINRLNIATQEFEYCLSDERNEASLSCNGGRSVLIDKENILYAGTTVGGLNIHNPQKDRFVQYKHNLKNSESLIHDVIFKFFEDSQGNIWIGTDGGGLSVFNPKTKTFQNYVHNPKDAGSISGNAVLAITEDKNHDIWIGTWGAGLNRYDRKTGKFQRYMPSPKDSMKISSPNIWDLHTDENGQIWISYHNLGADLFDIQKGVQRRYRPDKPINNGFAPAIINRIRKQKNGKIGFITESGYYELNKQNQLELEPKVNYPNQIQDILQDSQNNYWLATVAEGLILISPDGKRKQFNAANGFQSDCVNGILEDAHSNIWILTSCGLVSYSLTNKKFRYFTVADGLQSKQFTRFAQLKAQDGNIYIGGFKGFNVFSPNSFKENTNLPTVYIDEFQIFNDKVSVNTPDSPLKQVISETKELILSYKQSVFSFGFTAINFTYPQKARYAYKMEGYDKKWNYTDNNRRYVTYTNLDAGTYTFMVKATNNDGVWSSSIAKLKIKITPPWWKTWLFRIFLILTLSIILVSYYRNRINALTHQKMLLEGKVKERTRELESANIDLKEKQEEILQQNEEIIQQTEELQTLADTLSMQNEQLKELDKFKQTVTGTIVHDLKNPINSVILLSDLSYYKNLIDDEVMYLRMINQSGKQMLHLVMDILDTQRFENAKLKLELNSLSVREIITEAMDQVPLLLENKELNVVNSVEAALNVYGDFNILARVFTNLLTNAIKFTDKNGTITFKSEPSEKPQKVILSITDTGSGIPADVLPIIFEKFSQAEARDLGKTRSTGLGLSFCRMAVEAHSGRIWVESELNVGSTFYIELNKA